MPKKQGQWRASQNFSELECAHYWHLDPDRWDALSDAGKEKAMAYMMEQSDIDSVEASEIDKQRAKTMPPKKKGGRRQ